MTDPGAATSVRRSLLRALPSGTVAVGVGVVVLGVSAYLFLALSAHALTAEQFSTLSVLWVAVYTIGPGLFFPLEQEVARALAERRARGLGGGPVFRRAGTLGLVLAVVLIALAGGAAPTYIQQLFDGSWGMLAALLLSLPALWSAHLSRGLLAGGSEFGRYGAMLAIEGVGRSAVCVVFAVAAVHWVPAYGLLIPGAIFASVVLVLHRRPDVAGAGPSTSWNELSGALGWLLVAALFSQALVNVGPIAVKLLASSGEHSKAGQFLAGTVLVRVPLFLFAAVQAALLPGLANLTGQGDYTEFRRRLTRVLLLVGSVGGLATLIAAVAGPEMLRVLFGSQFQLGVVLLVELAVANAVYMVGAVLGQALVALRRYRAVALGWTCGVAAFIVMLATGGSILHRATNGFVVGAVVSVTIFGAALLRAMSRTGDLEPRPAPYTSYMLIEE